MLKNKGNKSLSMYNQKTERGITIHSCPKCYCFILMTQRGPPPPPPLKCKEIKRAETLYLTRCTTSDDLKKVCCFFRSLQ